MRTDISEDYKSYSELNIRNVGLKISTDGTIFDTDSIINADIKRSITDGSFGIGYTQSDRLSFSVISSAKVPKNALINLYTQINNINESMGRFYCTECTRDGSALNVTAYDFMYFLSEVKIKFTGKPSASLSALEFPCAMQDMLNYLCTLERMYCDFTCESFIVQDLPTKPDGSYFSARELIGFIAASHGCNAKIDGQGRLQFKRFEAVDAELSEDDVLDFKLDDSSPFVVKGILFSVDNETQIYIDDVPGSEYDAESTGIIKCYNPLASVEVANYVWHELGGLKYYGATVTRRGAGIIECGDVINIQNLKYPSDRHIYPFCVSEISYTISASEGFIETLSSNVEKPTNSGTVPAGSSSKSSSHSVFFSKKPPTEGYKNGDVWFQTADYTEQYDRISAVSQYNAETPAWELKGAFVSDGGGETSYTDIYSTSEVKTNKIWIDGKPIYRLVYIASVPPMHFLNNILNYPTDPSITSYDLSDNISGIINTVLTFSGVYEELGGFMRTIVTNRNLMWGAKNEYNILTASDNKLMDIKASFSIQRKSLTMTNYIPDGIPYSVYVILEYTKTEE